MASVPREPGGQSCDQDGHVKARPAALARVGRMERMALSRRWDAAGSFWSASASGRETTLGVFCRRSVRVASPMSNSAVGRVLAGHGLPAHCCFCEDDDVRNLESIRSDSARLARDPLHRLPRQKHKPEAPMLIEARPPGPCLATDPDDTPLRTSGPGSHTFGRRTKAQTPQTHPKSWGEESGA